MKDTITVTGNIATDPEQRAIRGDDTVTSFRLASTERRIDPATNTWIDGHTNYYSVSAFGQLGRHAYASLRRGQRIIVSGRFRLKEWDNGTKRGTSAEIDASAIGHDLRYGTTTFERDNAGRAVAVEPEAPDSPPDSELVTTGVDGWSVPPAVGAADTPF